MGHKINSLVRGSHKRDMTRMLSNQTVNDPQVEDILYWRVIGQDFSMSGKIYPDQSVRTLHLIKHMKHAMTLKVRFMVLKFILPNLIFQPFSDRTREATKCERIIRLSVSQFKFKLRN